MLLWGKGKEEKPAAAAPAPHVSASPRSSGAMQPVTTATDLQGLPTLLLSEGKITEQQLQTAMVKQIETGRFIGEILIEDGVLDQDSLISFLAKHCKIPHLSLLDYLIDKEIVKLLPEDLCLRCRLLPIDKLGKNLTVAMVNPLDTEALAEIRRFCPDLRIKPILCASNHFEVVSRRLFANAETGEPHSLSASSLGLSIPKNKRDEKKPTNLPEAARPAKPLDEAALQPLQDNFSAGPEVSNELDEVVLPPLAPLPTPTPTYDAPSNAEEIIPDADEVAPVMPLPEEAPVSAPAAQVLNGVFHEPAPAPGPPPKLQESGLGDTASMMMKEMATVMMDSMRDTYAVLARRMELFRGVPPEEVAKIFARGITREFEEGDLVFEKGQPGTEMYVILGGEIIIKDGGKELARLTRGGMFGEMSLLSAHPRSASAVAAETSSVLALSNEAIRSGMPPHVSIQLLSNIVTTLSERLRQANAG